MRFLFNLCFPFVALFFTVFPAEAQDSGVTHEFKAQTISQLATYINDFYVFPEVANATSNHLLKQWKEGAFDSFNQYETFADALTDCVQSVNKDKHMRILLVPPFESHANTPERVIEEQLDRIDRTRKLNGGLATVQLLEGNIGYLEIRSFAGMEDGKAITDAYMKLLEQADAIMIDLRENTGGSPVMVQYLCSYFFDRHIHLNNLYFRKGDELHEFWTLDEVGGTKLPDVPLFVITSNKTFSGAEEFAYNMQTQKRALIIGQVTGGGANPGQSMNLNEKLRVIMPMGMAINPVTKTNWEGTGVQPDIHTEAEESLKKAHHLAVEAAEEYRKRIRTKYIQLYSDLYAGLKVYEEDKSEELFYQSLKACVENQLIQEWEINQMGYEKLQEEKNIKIALCLFKVNTLLFSDSPNTYDSYAEALFLNGQPEKAMTNYQKAIDLAVQTKTGDVELYKENLDNAKRGMEEKK